MDAIDRRIVSTLQANARISYAELGRTVGLSAPAVTERVRRLESDGVIIGYRAHIAPEASGQSILAFVRMTSPVELGAQLTNLVRDIPEVLEFHHVTGTEGFVLKVAVSSVPHLERVIAMLVPFGQTNTSIVLSSPVTWRDVEIPLGD